MADATCAGCGCACDDIEATVTDGRLTVTRTCALGDAWFAERAGAAPSAAIDGRAASVEEAAQAAAEILREARAPLVYGLGRASCEAQRRAVALAEAIGAVVDLPGGTGAGLAYQALGSSTATFGEIRDRAQLVVAWRADPAVTNPRLLERLRVQSRPLIVVDAQPTATAEGAERFVALDAAADFEALGALRALVTGAPLDRERAAPLPLDALDDLAGRLLGVDHVAFLHGALDELGALALFALGRDLRHDRHAVTLALRRDGTARGAEDVLAWQTGCPAAVSFARGHPRANPGELDAAGLLERGEVDAALVIGADAPPGLGDLPTVVVGAAQSPAARVAFATAIAGIDVAGTAHRMDGVPVPLRALLDGDRPTAEDVLDAIAERL